MSFWKKLFGAKESQQTTSGNAKRTAGPKAEPATTPPSALLEKNWQRFFELVSIHESVQPFFKSFVGPWPADVRPDAFSGHGFRKFIDRLQSHIIGPYPVATLKKANHKPSYQIVNGKIARGYSYVIDMLIWGVIPTNEMSSQDETSGREHMIVWRLIEKYSSWSLTKLLFALPSVIQVSEDATDGKAGILVIEDVKIQVYKGIENTIFGAYEDLPDGGYLSDLIIEQKLRKLLPN